MQVKMKMTIFDSVESDGNDGVEDEARFHSYDKPQLASEALFFPMLLDATQCSDGWSVSMEDIYNRVSIDDDQRFDYHVLSQT